MVAVDEIYLPGRRAGRRHKGIQIMFGDQAVDALPARRLLHQLQGVEIFLLGQRSLGL